MLFIVFRFDHLLNSQNLSLNICFSIFIQKEKYLFGFSYPYLGIPPLPPSLRPFLRMNEGIAHRFTVYHNAMANVRIGEFQLCLKKL